MTYEERIYNKGYNLVACIDEVGRGCLAGDVVACAVIMPRGKRIEGIDDSKKISKKKRESLYRLIIEDAEAIGIGRINSKVIDSVNIKEATKLAMKEAVINLKNKNGDKVKADYLLIDAEEIDLDLPQEGLVRGDQKSYGIACASILAKVYRDNLCIDWDKNYPGYNIKQNKGYGTKEHRDNLLKLGPSPIHRNSFLKKILK